VGNRDYLANPTPVPVGTLSRLFLETVDRFGSKTAFQTILPDGFSGLSYLDVLERVRMVAAAMTDLGIGRGDRVAILAENRLEWSQVDYATLCLGAPLVPIHTTLTSSQIAYILDDSGARLLFASNKEHLDKALEACRGCPREIQVVAFDGEAPLPPGVLAWNDFIGRGRGEVGTENPEAFRRRALEADPDDPATIIYTSGTTGDPKGVVLTQNNLFSNVKATEMHVPVGPADRTLSFLPLSHVFQRMVDYYMFSAGATITYARSLKTVAEDMRISAPTKVAGAPRVYEKFYSSIMDQAGSRGILVRWARGVGEAWAEEVLSGRKPAWTLRMVYRLADALVFRKIHQAVGGQLVFFFSGSAPLAPHINRFFFSAGIHILEGYGLTETSPAVTMTALDDFQIGTVGPPIPGTEVRLAEDGEILVRGPQVMKGYFNRPEQTAEAFDSQGWLRTGDIGEFDERGHLRITDRKKNILVTTGGKNIAPAPIENRVKENRFVDQVVMIGDQRHFPALLVVPSFDCLEAWARSVGITAENRTKLLEDGRVREHLGKEILGSLGALASYEMPKKIGLIGEEFTIEGGILTPNQKVKRRVVQERYGSLIERMYDPANRAIDVFTEKGG